MPDTGGLRTSRSSSSITTVSEPTITLVLHTVREYDEREQVVRLTGPDSERLLAAWLGVPEIDPGELIARR
jgi:hypothetical protein